MEIKKTVVVGAGTMGNGIAQVLGHYNFPVTMVDLDETALQKGMMKIEANLNRLVEKEKITAARKNETLGRIKTESNLQNAVEGCDLVIEAVSEKVAIKTQIFRDLDKWCDPKTILASNTSAISITMLAGATGRPEKVIGMHFMNPVPIMKLVEIIRGYSTAPETVGAITGLVLLMEKIPVEVGDYPGFISNRLLMPMINESIFALYERVAGVEEIDVVMKLGMAHPMGPLQLADFIGLDICLHIMNVLYDGFRDSKYRPCPLLVKMVEANKLGVKSGEGFYVYGPDHKITKVSTSFIGSL